MESNKTRPYEAAEGIATSPSGMSRRSFLAGAAAFGAGAAAFGLAGCQPNKDAEAQGTATEATPDERTLSKEAEQLDYDVVVIGAGTSGTCAALAAAQAGAKTVIVEKTDLTGGQSNYSTFIVGAGTALQQDAGYDVTTDELYAAHREYYKGTCYLPLVRTIFDNASDTIDWLMGNGLGIIACPEGLSVQSNLPRNQEVCGHMMTGPTREPQVENAATPGNFNGLYATYFEDCGGEIMLQTEAFKLLTDESGQKVTGVACERKDGSQVLLNAKAVILAAGSYSGDDAFFRDQLGHDPIYNQEAISANSGDGIAMAKEVGGQPWASSPFWHQVYISNLDGSENYSMIFREATIIARMPVFPWVDPEGNRFADESVSGDFSRFANTAWSQGGSYWILLDQDMVADLEVNGTPVPIIGCSPGDDSARTGTESIVNAVGQYSGPMTGITKLLDDFAAEGQIVKASDLDDLCAQTNMDKSVLSDTIATYNQAVESKHDTLFLKDPLYLHYQVGSGPYYALRATVNCEGGSLGGVRVNKGLKVFKRETAKPFDNLFAAGLNAGGFFGVGGYVDICGCTMGFAVNSGRLAGEGAAAVATA